MKATSGLGDELQLHLADDDLEINIYESCGQLWAMGLESFIFYAERFSSCMTDDELDQVLWVVWNDDYYKDRIKRAWNLEEKIGIFCEASCELSEYEEDV